MNTMRTRTKPNATLGALVGLVVTLPFLIVFFLAQVWFGTPFVPFDLFDWITRILPGGIVNFGIDTIVSIIAALNLDNTAGAAKIAEHILAILIIVVLGVTISAVLFVRWKNSPNGDRRPAGLFVGAAFGLFAAVITAGVNQSASANPLISLIWIVMVFAAWGTTVEYFYGRFAGMFSSNPERAYVEMLDRRRFLIQIGGAAAAITLVGAILGGFTGGANDFEDDEASTLPTWSSTNKLPNADDPVIPAPGTRPEFTDLRDHYRIDINSLPPVLHESDWSLSIYGMVENSLNLTLDDLRTKYKPLDQFVTLECISNPLGGDLISTQRWTGVSLKDILSEVKPKQDGLNIKITSADGFDESLTVAQAMADERIMLTYAWDGVPLPTAHGFPLRIYIPDLYGMKQPKWIVNIEISDTFEDGYWVRRGWDSVARVQTTSVVDTIAGDQLVHNGDQTLVPIGGIAYAGKRGISKVEVRMDNGQWNEAQLRHPTSDTTWVIWRYDWPFVGGDHVAYVRCVDGTGAPQIEAQVDEAPSGATGIVSRYSHL